MLKVLKLISLGAFLMVTVPREIVSQQARPLMEPTDREVALAGILHEELGYGPPGYGESKKVDARIRYWALDLPETITLACEADKPEWVPVQCEGSNHIKLFVPLPPEGDRLRQMIRKFNGKRIVATGVLRRRATMAEITPIYMNVTDIDLVKVSP